MEAHDYMLSIEERWFLLAEFPINIAKFEVKEQARRFFRSGDILLRNEAFCAKLI